MTEPAADQLTDAAVGGVGSALRTGLESDYSPLVVLPIVLVVLWVAVWKFGGGKELVAALVSVVDTIKDSLVCAKEIAEIHERVVMKSPVEYREVIKERVKNPDHTPSSRLRRDAAEA